MAHFATVSSKQIVWALGVFSVTLSPAFALPPSLPTQTDCKIYEQQEQANLAMQTQADPHIHAARLDSVFYSVRNQACLASVVFSKGDATYAGIVDISGQRTLWARTYRGTHFSPARVVEMDNDLDEAIKGLEVAPTVADTNSHAYDFLPLLLDRTMNTLPAIKNAFVDSH